MAAMSARFMSAKCYLNSAGTARRAANSLLDGDHGMTGNTLMKLRILGLAAIGWLFATHLNGQTPAEWSQWRGANRDGLSAETGLLQDWPKSGPPLKWKTTGAGIGYSSFSSSNGRLY